MVGRNVRPVFEGGSLTLLRALQSRFDLQIMGVRPDPSSSVDTLFRDRVNAVGQENLIEEAREGLQRGYRDTTVMRDDVVYLPLVQHLDGLYTKDEAFERIHSNLVGMHHRQMEAYLTMPEIEWVDSLV